jgi:hypothetical protein
MSRYEDLPALPQLDKEPATLRQSLIRVYDECPRAAYLSLKHGGGVPSHPQYRGTVFHKTVERCTRELMAQGEQQIDPLDAKAVMVEVLEKHPEFVVSARHMDELRIMVHKWAVAFRLPAPDCQVEIPLEMPVAGRTVTGTIDLLWTSGSTLYVRDYKTGWHLYAQEDVSGKDPDTGQQKGARSAQLIVYALLAAYGHNPVWRVPKGIETFDLAFCFPAFGDGELVERGVVMERAELNEHRAWLETTVKNMDRSLRTGRWQPVPGSQCARCVAPRDCPVPGLLRPNIGPFERDPSEAAEDVLFMKADVDRLMKELKAYVQEFGPVTAGSDQVLAFTEVTSSRTDAKAKARLEAGEVVPPDELFKKSVSTRFGFKKVS